MLIKDEKDSKIGGKLQRLREQLGN
jgi:hypothetical protein